MIDLPRPPALAPGPRARWGPWEVWDSWGASPLVSPLGLREMAPALALAAMATVTATRNGPRRGDTFCIFALADSPSTCWHSHLLPLPLGTPTSTPARPHWLPAHPNCSPRHRLRRLVHRRPTLGFAPWLQRFFPRTARRGRASRSRRQESIFGVPV